MSDFNTFTGKTVDDAIGEACRFFAVERDKLEVEIVSGGSTGIFGLVGKKKAQIKARRRIDPGLAALIQEEESQNARAAAAFVREEPQADVQAQRPAQENGRGRGDNRRERGNGSGNDQRRADQPRSRNGRPQQRRDAAPQAGAQAGDAPAQPHSEAQPGDQPAQASQPRPRPERGEPRNGRRPRQGQPREASREARDAADLLDDDAPDAHDAPPAPPELIALVEEVMKRLLTPILEQEPAMRVEGSTGRLCVSVLDEEHSGLLIGREGQTLAALQYLANRIVARRWETPVRVQLNTGEYREKQDDSLRRMALYLADKARNLGRPQSTKPLSSYHRRVIHLALQADDTIQTRSKGEGPLKRVIIVPRKPKAQPAQAQ